MKPLLISTRDIGGGAARAAYRLFQGLRKSGLPARMLVREAASGHPEVARLQIPADRELRRASARYWMAQYALIDQRRTRLSNSWFSFPYPGFDLTLLPLVREAEITNVHWVAHFQSVESMGTLLQTGKPVVWTLHDANPFTGGCHYTAGCHGFTNTCRDCPQLERDSGKIPATVLANKLRRWRGNLCIVAPSNWMASMARNSHVFADCPVQVIPNAVDDQVFRPRSREESRRQLGIPPEATAIMFCAEAHGETRKGFSHLLEALRICAASPDIRLSGNRFNLLLLTVGKAGNELGDMGLPIHALGYLRSEEEMVRAYSAADVFVQPSLEDNLPNTIMEAMACGIAVAAFAAGGIPDLVQNGETGLLCPVGDSEALARAIMRLAMDLSLRKRLGRAARLRVEKEYRLEHQARQYGDLFRSLTPAEDSSASEWITPAMAELKNWHPVEDPRLQTVMRDADRRNLLRPIRHRPAGGKRLVPGEDSARIIKARLLAQGDGFIATKVYELLRRCWRVIRKLR